MSINPYEFRYVSGVENEITTTPSFGETLSASLAYQYDPIFEHLDKLMKH